MKVPIGISNHHVHITEEDFKILFGKDAVLEPIKDLKQPGQFACKQKVTIKVGNGSIDGLRILGPFREYTQVELSQTECRTLKVSASICSSGKLDGAREVMIVGPAASIIRPALIIADRHIHITKEDREKFGLLGVSEVKLRIYTEKGGILDHVKIREASHSYFEAHLDTDDGNAFLIESDIEGEILI